ncbi:uncharacterized protein LTR77_006407 [Saxophila tyrrhenica]|uniref:AB hydrolase-1 domain-containing protein n=1 Tax=Saxophila tyrrhenica TaxID=1690608 RepID=A0AAV9P8L3_9PEZI|nr:hypothetical protein LTR77_006407 [Saxophila tyrrhenica]
MATSLSVPTYHDLPVTAPGLGNFTIHYISAGAPTDPTLLLLHGFPSSSTQYRNVIPLLSDSYHVLAPDLPGYGLTTSPAEMKYTFANLTAAIAAWLLALEISSYAVYVFDYGAPVAWRLALEKPASIKAIISQNGNAYDAGFGHPFWTPIEALWNETKPNSVADREWLRENYLTIPATKGQYYTGFPASDHELVDPVQPTTDFWMNLHGRENQERQLDLFYDYRTNLPLYSKIQKWFRESQVPMLAVWGKADPIFVWEGAEAFRKDLPEAEVHALEAGHFVLETKGWEVAQLIKGFLGRNRW